MPDIEPVSHPWHSIHRKHLPASWYGTWTASTPGQAQAGGCKGWSACPPAALLAAVLQRQSSHLKMKGQALCRPECANAGRTVYGKKCNPAQPKQNWPLFKLAQSHYPLWSATLRGTYGSGEPKVLRVPEENLACHCSACCDDAVLQKPSKWSALRSQKGPRNLSHQRKHT